jgi:hypothetical protein
LETRPINVAQTSHFTTNGGVILRAFFTVKRPSLRGFMDDILQNFIARSSALRVMQLSALYLSAAGAHSADVFDQRAGIICGSIVFAHAPKKHF